MILEIIPITTVSRMFLNLKLETIAMQQPKSITTSHFCTFKFQSAQTMR